MQYSQEDRLIVCNSTVCMWEIICDVTEGEREREKKEKTTMSERPFIALTLRRFILLSLSSFVSIRFSIFFFPFVVSTLTSRSPKGIIFVETWLVRYQSNPKSRLSPRRSTGSIYILPSLFWLFLYRSNTDLFPNWNVVDLSNAIYILFNWENEKL